VVKESCAQTENNHQTNQCGINTDFFNTIGTKQMVWMAPAPGI